MKHYSRSHASSFEPRTRQEEGSGAPSLQQRAYLQRRYAASRAGQVDAQPVMRSAQEDYGPPSESDERANDNGPAPEETESTQSNDEPIGTVHSIDGVNIRSSPEMADNILDTLDRGGETEVYGQEGSWYEIEHDGEQAYVTTLTSAVDFVPNGEGEAPIEDAPATEGPGDEAPSVEEPMAGAPDEESPESGYPAGGGQKNAAPGRLGELMSQEILDVAEIAEARALIEQLPEGQQAEQFLLLQEKVKYANQRDNESDQETADGGTCAFTSIAMAMQMLGIPNPQPDKQFEDVLVEMAGDGDITTAAVWENVASELGVGMDVVVGDRRQIDRAEWEEIRDNHLAKGQGVIVSLWGHVVRLQEVNDAGIVVDDPYGKSTIKESERRDRDDSDAGKYNWEGSNSTEAGEGDNKGENVSYEWEDVLTYTFGGVYAFSV